MLADRRADAISTDYGVKRRDAAPWSSTADDSAYARRSTSQKAGVTVVGRSPICAPSPDGRCREAARARASRSCRPRVITGTRGRLRVIGVSLGKLAADGSVVAVETVACDLVLMSGGWTPSVHLFSQSRGKLRFDEAAQVFVPGQSAQRERSAGACNGTFELAAQRSREGAAAGEARQATRACRRPETPASVAVTVVGEIAPSGGCHGAPCRITATAIA